MQVVVFSATMPEEASELAMQWMKSPSKLEFRPSARSVSQTITQVVHVCAEHKKPGKLQKHLEMIKEKATELRQKPRILIFANTVKVRNLERNPNHNVYLFVFYCVNCKFLKPP